MEEYARNDGDPAGGDGVKTVGGIAVVCVIGQIEGHVLLPETQKATKYEHLLPTLCAAQEDRAVTGVLILLNTVGGDVEAGLAIAELIASLSKPTASLVLGGGHSIGVPLACAADRSFIVPSATMTLHPVRVNGPVLGSHQSFDYLEKMQARIDSFIVRHSRCTRERLSELTMRTGELATDIGTVLDGDDAVREGIIDAAGGLDDAIGFLRAPDHSAASPSTS